MCLPFLINSINNKSSNKKISIHLFRFRIYCSQSIYNNIAKTSALQTLPREMWLPLSHRGLIFTLKNRTTKWYDFAVTPYFTLLHFLDAVHSTHDAPTKIKDLWTLNRLDFFSTLSKNVQIHAIYHLFMFKHPSNLFKNVQKPYFLTLFIFALNSFTSQDLRVVFPKVLKTRCPIDALHHPERSRRIHPRNYPSCQPTNPIS